MQDALGSVVTPALLAGAVAVGATIAVERLGGRLGGVLASIPTTIVPASLGMLATAADDGAFVTAMAAVPVGMLVDALFLLSWRVLPQRLPGRTLASRLGLMATVSLGIWAAAAAVAVVGLGLLGRVGVHPLASGAAALVVQFGAGVLACRGAPPAPRGNRRVPPLVLLGRGALGAIAIGVSILVAAAGAPVLGGMASVFPAIFLTTMVSLWVAQGEAVPVGAVGPIVLGSASVAVYALLAAWALPALGPVVGTVSCWLAAVGSTSLPAALWLTRASTPEAA